MAFAYGMIGKRLASTVVTAPILFISVGAALSIAGLVPVHESEVALHFFAEITLVILLFLDAAKICLPALRQQHSWPLRMLLIGLPLVILFGIFTGMLVFPHLPLAVLALIAAIFAPTDAALGQPVVSDPHVPERARLALTVESGLNDGMALPAVLLFASVASGIGTHSGAEWLVFGLKQITLGPIAGVIVGLAGGWALLFAKSRRWTAIEFEGVAALALAGAAFFSAGLIGGNGFIAAFVAGLSFGFVVGGRCKFVFEFTENEGQILAWGSFLLLGAALVPTAITHLTVPMLMFILISLFILRPLVVWISLIGTDTATETRLFFGWFGPRGLATALFALMVVKQLNHDLGEFVLMAAVNMVWISALLHGVTAAVGARWYGARINKMGPCPETMPIEQKARPLPVGNKVGAMSGQEK